MFLQRKQICMTLRARNDALLLVSRLWLRREGYVDRNDGILVIVVHLVTAADRPDIQQTSLLRRRPAANVLGRVWLQNDPFRLRIILLIQ